MSKSPSQALGFMVVAGDSMWPALRSGDAVLCEPVATASPGDIVVARLPHAVVAHRVVRWSSTEVILRGDAVAVDDAAVPAALVLGKVSRVRRAGVEYAMSELDGVAPALSRSRLRLKRALARLFRRLRW